MTASRKLKHRQLDTFLFAMVFFSAIFIQYLQHVRKKVRREISPHDAFNIGATDFGRGLNYISKIELLL